MKLNAVAADYKFFFVTEPRTFEVVKKKYAVRIPGVKVVLLPSAEEYVYPTTSTKSVPKYPASQNL